MRKRSALARYGVLLALSAVLAACGDRPSLFSTAPRFQLSAAEAARSPIEPAAPAVPGAVVYGPASLTVHLKGFLASFRRVLATMADVETVEVTVRFESAGSVIELVERVDRAALAGGQTSVTFASLPEGSVTIWIAALDAQGQVIGTDGRRAFLQADVPTRVDVSIPLSKIAGSGGGSSGGGSPPAPSLPTPPAQPGALDASISMTDGGVEAGHAPGTVLGTIEGMRFPSRIWVAPSGEVWALIEDLGRKLVKWAPDGTRLTTLSVGYDDRFALDGQGHVWRVNGSMLYRYDADGVLVGSQSTSVKAIAADGAGRIWVGSGRYVSRLETHAQAAENFMLAVPEDQLQIEELTLDPTSGAIWLVTQEWQAGVRKLFKMTPDGQTASERLIPLSSGSPAVGSQGQVWLPSFVDQQIMVFAPDGSLTASYPTPSRPGTITADPAGHFWVCAGPTLLKMAADGAILKEYRPGPSPSSVALALDGSLWLSHNSGQVGRLTRLSP